MRTILFRGKRIDNGEWVEGNYVAEFTGSPNIAVWIDKLIEPENNFWEPQLVNHEVVPETVGQYTELDDKAGNKIFEGDVVTGLFDGEFSRPDVTAKIIFSMGSFVENYFGYNLPDHKGNMSVIGNIHDNPELLKS